MVFLCWALPALAQPAPSSDFGLDFVTVGDPGNPDADVSIYPSQIGQMPVGGVGYEYRIMRSKIDVGTWVEFVDFAYPYRNVIGVGDFGLLGDFIGVQNFNAQPGEEAGAFIRAGAADWATTGSWRAAAHFSNWLHNDKARTVGALMDGAYDFVNGGRDLFHEPDAKYWIPDIDEWSKAVYWDPDRYGPGEGGYWTQPNGSDTKLVPGVPGVGETPATIFRDGIALGLYPGVQSPWGLEDISGHGFEAARFDESVETVPGRRLRVASDTDELYEFWDQLGTYRSWGDGVPIGIRLAASVPAPGAGAALIGCGVVVCVRRRRR